MTTLRDNILNHVSRRALLLAGDSLVVYGSPEERAIVERARKALKEFAIPGEGDNFGKGPWPRRAPKVWVDDYNARRAIALEAFDMATILNQVQEAIDIISACERRREEVIEHVGRHGDGYGSMPDSDRAGW